MSIASLLNVILIILGFGMLIGIHELGHFIAAKWSGIRTNAFAVGMGPVFLAWRGGIGLTFGASKTKVIEKFGKDASDMSDVELKEHGLSETEYSLRFLPIGGFVGKRMENQTLFQAIFAVTTCVQLANAWSWYQQVSS